MFVICSTNAGQKSLVKVIICNDVPGYHVEAWKSGTFSCTAVGKLYEPKKCEKMLYSFNGTVAINSTHFLKFFLEMYHFSKYPLQVQVLIVPFTRPFPGTVDFFILLISLESVSQEEPQLVSVSKSCYNYMQFTFLGTGWVGFRRN